MKSKKAKAKVRRKPTAGKTQPKKPAKTRAIKVDNLARVEGEGALYLKIKGKEITDLRFNIFEPPRFFEAFLRGRKFFEVPDITARICGICPIAYQMSSTQAIEYAFGVKVPDRIHQLRRLIYCGEWIESHVLHVFMLHAPDFLGYEDAIRMAKDHGDLVKMALRMKRIGNDLVTLVGGREIHPINLKIGGFYSSPKKSTLRAITDELKWARDAAIKTVEFVGTLEFPDFERDYKYVALHHPDTYAIIEGRLASNRGMDIDISEYEDHFVELHVKHSNALHSVHREKGGYHVGPLARVVLNYDQLTPTAKEAAEGAGLTPDCKNPFKSIIARSVEVVYACEEALRIIGEYEEPETPSIEVKPVAGTGYGVTEAPRGILYHKYRIDEKGVILNSKLVPPTSQNQVTIEEDLREYVKTRLNLSDDKLTWQCEQAIRNYDPCISCATHFLDRKLREPERLLVIGIGNEFRADDAAGLIAADKLKNTGRDNLTVKTSSRDGSALLYLWEGYDNVILIDAVRSGAEPGTMHVINLPDPDISENTFRTSGHNFSVFEVVKLAGYIGKAPRHITLYAVEGENFKMGEQPSDAVIKSVEKVVGDILDKHTHPSNQKQHV